MQVNMIRRKENTKSLCNDCSIKNECKVYNKFGAAFDIDNCENYEMVNKDKEKK